MADRKFNPIISAYDNEKKTAENFERYKSRDDSPGLNNDAILLDKNAFIDKQSHEDALREKIVAEEIARREKELRERIEKELRGKIENELRDEYEKSERKKAASESVAQEENRRREQAEKEAEINVEQSAPKFNFAVNDGEESAKKTKPKKMPKASKSRRSVRSVRVYSDVKWFPVLFLALSMASAVVMKVFNLPMYAILLANVAELALFFGLFNKNSGLSNYGEEYHTATITVFTVISVAMAVLSLIYLESFLPHMQKIHEMADVGQASKSYYNYALDDARTIAIIGVIVLVGGMIAGVVLGKKNVPSVTMPLALISGIIILFYILDALIATQMPKGYSSVYASSLFIWNFLGSILIAIPSAIYLLVIHIIGRKISND